VEGFIVREYSDAKDYLSGVGEEASTDADLARGRIVIGKHTCETTPSGVNIGEFKVAAKRLARGPGEFWMQTEQTFQSIPVIGRGVKSENAKLGVDMLDMYLNQVYDQKVIDRIAEAVKQSEQYETLGKFVRTDVKGHVDAAKPPSEMELKALVQNALELARKPRAEGGLGFYFSGEGLQPVIGGMTGLWVSACRYNTPVGAIKTARNIDYTCDVVIEDTYDFDNNRTVIDKATSKRRETAYSLFRTKLADLLKQGKYCEFETEYNKAIDDAPIFGGDWDHLNKGHIFASYMYALEKAGFFKGIAWSITVPMKGSFSGPGSIVKPGDNRGGL